MKQQADLRFTSEIYARRFLDCGPDGSVVVWAENMTLSGFVSDSLFILLGEVEPFNKFEIDELLDRIQYELQIPKVSHKDEALEIIATAYVQRFIQGKTNSADALYAISQLCIEQDHADAIYDFYLLHYAAVDLAIEDTQYYWPDAHRGNIEKVIRNRCINWLEEHPIAEWRNYEWTVT
ncbi:hypothetical protein [Ruegeria sp. EL01]|jgi:hypothetical protein|uniref:hypothetical protein n=1 Tax=Ruegeria sp. EL01 TaxID=2107578 RepID=UPI0013C43572|nr:hypothetical protein [Ruegeria sp. EL01]